MDWRTLPSNSALHTLIFERVAEANPELSLDELYESSSRFVKEFDIYIGSQSATVTYGELDAEAISLFRHGACTLLALALHDRTGLPLVLFTSRDVEADGEWSGHAAVLAGPHTVLDATGLTSFAEVSEDYRRYGSGVSEARVVTRDEFLDVVTSDPDYREDPMSFVDELERLLIADYAVILEKKNL
jgi:hypothetical protein